MSPDRMSAGGQGAEDEARAVHREDRKGDRGVELAPALTVILDALCAASHGLCYPVSAILNYAYAVHDRQVRIATVSQGPGSDDLLPARLRIPTRS
jgi:hypothetical protein